MVISYPVIGKVAMVGDRRGIVPLLTKYGYGGEYSIIRELTAAF
jgi:hypothetical protein